MITPSHNNEGFLAELALKRARAYQGGRASWSEDNLTQATPELQAWGMIVPATENIQSSGVTKYLLDQSVRIFLRITDDPFSTTREGATGELGLLGHVVVGEDTSVMLSMSRVVAAGPAFAPNERLTFEERDPWAKLANRIASYQTLEPNWDGYEGRAPSPKAIGDALQFLDLLPRDMPMPMSGVAGDGEVGFHWRAGALYVEVSFYGDGKIIYHARKGDRVICAEDEEFNRIALPRKLHEQIARLQEGG